MNPFEIQDRYRKIIPELIFTQEPDNWRHPKNLYFLLKHEPTESQIQAIYYSDTGKLKLSLVSIKYELEGTCGLLVTYFFVKIFVIMSSYIKLYDNLKKKPEKGEVEVSSLYYEKAAMCYFKAFQAVGFRITPDSHKTLKKEVFRNRTNQLEQRDFYLEFDYIGGQLDHKNLYVFYKQTRLDEQGVPFEYTWKISKEGILLFRLVKNI